MLGHVGLRPQSLHTAGGYRVQGKSRAEATRLLADAEAIAKAGAFAMVIEGTVDTVARRITAKVPVPTIGIGASAACDGQILVTEDLLGLFAAFRPKFVKRYAALDEEVTKAARSYARDVRARRFPRGRTLFRRQIRERPRAPLRP